jgi:nucleotide-binding universal stress UspA family protein
MYRKMVVPLDGSELAECVLPHVKAIGTGCGVREVVLLRVVEPIPVEAPPAWDYEAVQKANAEVAEEYLTKTKTDLAKAGLNVSMEVLRGKPGDAITEFVENDEADLIAIATHGRSGITRWVFGSVADKLVRSCSVPILLIRPPRSESAT